LTIAPVWSRIVSPGLFVVDGTGGLTTLPTVVEGTVSFPRALEFNLLCAKEGGTLFCGGFFCLSRNSFAALARFCSMVSSFLLATFAIWIYYCSSLAGGGSTTIIWSISFSFFSIRSSICAMFSIRTFSGCSSLNSMLESVINGGGYLAKAPALKPDAKRCLSCGVEDGSSLPGVPPNRAPCMP